MPVYEYVCESCGGKSEALRPFQEADAAIICEQCGSRKTGRIHSVFSAGSHCGQETALPVGGCGRCGDPSGPCSL